MSQRDVYQQSVYLAQNWAVTKGAIHPAMERLYLAASTRGHIGKTQQQSALASLLNVAPQIINNWESRGPSASGLLTIQESTGINATWLLTGKGPMHIAMPLLSVAATGDVARASVDAHETLTDWPFVRLDAKKLRRLRRDDVLMLEGALLLAAGQLGLDVANELAA